MTKTRRILLALPALSRTRNTRPVFRWGVFAVLAAIVGLAMLVRAPRVQPVVASEQEQEESKVQIGFAIAPVPLNLEGKNRELVGLGSYIVNAQGDCNGCHSRGPQTEFLPTGNPYLLPPPLGPFSGIEKINPQTYLGGGNDFGPFPGLQHLYSRNLTPDKTGRPEGGHTFREFLTILRTGKDYDHIHPTCTGAPNGACVPPPFNGDKLQVMPWPVYRNMTDHDIRAIYEYLSSIPCIDTVIAGAPHLRNDCP
jgi:hypothetical protein